MASIPMYPIVLAGRHSTGLYIGSIPRWSRCYYPPRGWMSTRADVEGCRPLLLACNNRNTNIINILLDMPGGQADARSVHGASPLSAAARRVDRLFMKRLIQAGANPNRTDEEKNLSWDLFWKSLALRTKLELTIPESLDDGVCRLEMNKILRYLERVDIRRNSLQIFGDKAWF
ncbi:hypothetical protein ASPWEDRAFT_450226 [Aspergillus wentii DTO 134E9]|uniref:Uncharacterized protein n=1 Tax=Aspergillus wentii DTO 134E9 TaxID=1073089 RepID=A0A1L9RR01_ASPWE|nr:uncharacterized protein ASPWEDRAFT_450226 [Aspergillus wentii DTO 134E9]OJJ37359.1 hypothetical protein ASPWEDRAFT_450226 [Aspergillus wentii DTO 134E9]